MFNFGFRYNGEPDENLYGLKLSLTAREARTLDKIAVASRDASQAIIDYIDNNWSDDTPADAGEPPGVRSGNLASSGILLERDYTGRFTSEQNSKMFTILWDTRKGNAYHGRGEYAAVQEFGLDGLKSEHPFMRPAVEHESKRYKARLKDAL